MASNWRPYGVAFFAEGPFCCKPGIFRSRVVTRVWWAWFALKVIWVDEREYTTTDWAWDGA